MDTRVQVPVAASSRNVALKEKGFEPTMKATTVGDKRADNSRRRIPKSTPVFTQHGGATHEITISGNQVLVTLAAASCLAGPLVWAFVRWLFAL